MLPSCLKTYRYGQQKANSPQKTIKKVLFQLGVTNTDIKLLPLHSYDRLGLPAFICQLKEDHNEAYGKGVTVIQAKTSALMEWVERFSNRYFLSQKNQFLKACPQELPDYPLRLLVAPFAEVYHEEAIIHQLKKLPFLWAKGYDLTAQKTCLVPVHWFSAIYGTTGWAAGNCLAEATLQALCEIWERHCISVIVEEQKEVPTIEISSIKRRLPLSLLKKIEAAQIELIIKDFSLNAPIPTIAVIGIDRYPPVPELKYYATAGTHLNPQIALIRALTEFVQHRAQTIYFKTQLKRPIGPTYCFPKFKTAEDTTFLLKGPKRNFSSLPSYARADFKEEVNYVVSILKKQGLKVFMVETTHPKLGIPTVIVTVPGVRLNRPSTKLHPYLLAAREVMKQERYQEAAQMLEKAFKEQPSLENLPQVLCQAANCYQRIGLTEKAIVFYEKALQIAPQLIQSPKFIRDFQKAIEEIKRN